MVFLNLKKKNVMPLSYKNFGQKFDNYILFQEYNKYISTHIIVGLAIKFKLNDI